MIHLDTSVLIDALTGPRRSAAALREAIVNGERLAISTLVLYEWLRRPRREEELHVQSQLLPSSAAVPFDHTVAAQTSVLYRQLKRARGREIDLAIAACAISQGASLWALNEQDFKDIPGLALYRP